MFCSSTANSLDLVKEKRVSLGDHIFFFDFRVSVDLYIKVLGDKLFDRYFYESVLCSFDGVSPPLEWVCGMVCNVVMLA